MSSATGESRSIALNIALGIALLGAGFLLYRWWVQRGEDNRLRDGARAACVADVGEPTCSDHLARFHDDCARLTRRHPGRHSSAPEGTEPEAYLRCIELGADAWIADNGRKAEANARQRREDLAPQ